MLEIAVFLYGLCAGLVLMIAQKNRREAKPNPAVVQAMGWGLMSMSSVLALLLFAVAFAMALGATGPMMEALAH
jgi:Na+/H+ antiporter NhaC